MMKATLPARLVRWVLRLAEYDYEISITKVNKMPMAMQYHDCRSLGLNSVCVLQTALDVVLSKQILQPI